ncbi:hypothetical protein WR25_10402 [Diploscapter pachys]|uniref:G-protein coupled receptors family 1 profile domain-containing protein n=1 Tax=Diploscapter pachys TaxID=2018661 RepID=A0A2A2J885_9BILA|nr:hypothetical protein WR25_10402 [Diploscapter pachys]
MDSAENVASTVETSAELKQLNEDDVVLPFSSQFYGGDCLCRLLKFLSTFGFHLTANIQVLVALDRLFLTAKMNRVTRIGRNYQYNTRISLAISWILALICALPQLFIFRVAISPMNTPQCITKWLEFRLAHQAQISYIRQYDNFMQAYEEQSSDLFYPNGTFRYSVLPSPPPVPESVLNATLDQMEFLEGLYNIIHLSTICLLPYILELLCYSAILYILSVASKGDFISLKDLFIKFICCNRYKSSTNRSDNGKCESSQPTIESRTSGSQSAEWKNQSYLLNNSFRKVQLREEDPRPRSASFGSAPLPRQMPNSQSTASCLVSSQLSQAAQILPTKPSPSQTEPPVQRPSFLLRFIAGRVLRLSDERVPLRPRYASCAPTSTLDASTPARPRWLSTVEAARRSARKKTVLMLSLNLLFWGPYACMAIISQITLFDNFILFQYVSALVTFNSVSNILL